MNDDREQSSRPTAFVASLKNVATPAISALKHTTQNIPSLVQKYSTIEYTWDELAAIEKRRRDILVRGHKGLWSTLNHIDGSVFTYLLRDSLTWITILTYFGIRVQERFSKLPSFVASLGDSNWTVLGGFITFFMSFYVKESYTRFYTQYYTSISCKDRILDIASLASTHLPKATASRIVRYMNAAHISGYVGLSETYRYHNFFERLNTDFALLTERELQRMNDIDLEHGGCCHRELIVWCLHEIHSCHAEGILDNELAHEFREQILELRVAIGKMYSIGDFPIPFFFVHFICLLSALYLPMFAISAAYKAGSGDDKHWIADVIGGLVVVLQSVYLNGLRILGQKMSDPYGSDLTDFSVIFFVTYSWMKSNRILESEISVPNENEEEKLKRKRVSIGKPWDRRVEDNPFVLIRVESIPSTW